MFLKWSYDEFKVFFKWSYDDLSFVYIGDVKRDVARDNANAGDKQKSPLYLPWPPWAMRHR